MFLRTEPAPIPTTTEVPVTATTSVYSFQLSDPAGTLQRLVVDDNPNGVLPLGDGAFMLVSFNNKLVDIRTAAGSERSFELPEGVLDGAARFNDRIYVTSWEINGVYAVDVDSGTATVFTLGTAGPADPAVDTQRGRLLVPLLQSNQLVLIDLP